MLLKLLLILIIISNTTSALSINEIMFDPSGKDLGKEYIEFSIDNEEPFILNTSRGISYLKLEKSGEKLGIILDEKASIEIKENISIYKTKLNLKNKQDFIEIYNKNLQLLDKVIYTNKYGGKNGKALCRKDNKFFNCKPTPGFLYAESNNSEILIKGKTGVIYRSNDFKAKKYAVYIFIMGLLILLLDKWLDKWKKENIILE